MTTSLTTDILIPLYCKGFLNLSLNETKKLMHTILISIVGFINGITMISFDATKV